MDIPTNLLALPSREGTLTSPAGARARVPAGLRLKPVNSGWYLSHAGIPALFRGLGFEDFDPRGFEDEVSAVRAYAETATEHRQSLYLHGPVGTGKSHLAHAALQHIVAQGVSGYSITVPRLLDYLRKEDSGDYLDRMETLTECGALLLDDVGAHKSTEWTTEKVFVVVDARVSAMLPTIYTSNLTLDDLCAAPGWERIADRIAGSSIIVGFSGESYRIKRLGGGR